MAAELSMNGRKKIETIQKEFTNKFNYLTLLFLDENRKSLDISKSLSEVRKVKGTDISINAGLKVNTLEARFRDNYGLMVEVAYLKEGKVLHTKDNVDKTLNEMNRWCAENGCQKFEFKKSLRGDTVLSLQEQLFNAISEEYPDAVAKKMNKDNFMDVHLPSVNAKKGTHIFFNTAKDGIKFGFYCRDEAFVKSVLDTSSNIEEYAQGVRPVGNPLFTDVDVAAEAALAFIGEMIGESSVTSHRDVNPVIAEYVSAFQENPDPICDLLDSLGTEAGKMSVYKVDLDILSNLAFADIPEIDDLKFAGEVDINDWDGLAEIIGEAEAEANKNEYSNDEITSRSKIIFLYSGDEYVYSFLNPGDVLSADDEMQNFLDNLEIDDSDDEVDEVETSDEDETDDLGGLIINELPSKVSDTRLYEVNGKFTFTIGYDGKAYMNEDVIGVIPDTSILEALNSGDTWSDFIWNNGWTEYDSKVHNHGIIEPATHLELPSGERVVIKLSYDTPDFDKQKIAFKNTSGKFIHISTSFEKTYDWNGWKKYKINFGPGVFDTSKISVSFDDDIVSGYCYNYSETDSIDFTEDNAYKTTGIGFSSDLYFNNGKELVLIDLEEFSNNLNENNISKEDIEAIKKYLMNQ